MAPVVTEFPKQPDSFPPEQPAAVTKDNSVVVTENPSAQYLRTESLPNISPTWRTNVFVNEGKEPNGYNTKTLDEHINETPQQKVEKISPRYQKTDGEKPTLDNNTLKDLLENRLLGDTLEITGFKIEGKLDLPRDIKIKLTNCEFDKGSEINFQGLALEIDNCKFNEQTFLKSYYKDTDIKISNSTFATLDKKCHVVDAAKNSLTIIGGAKNLEIQNSTGILNLTSLELENNGTAPNKVKYLNEDGQEITSFNELSKNLRVLTPQKYLHENILEEFKNFKQNELENKISKLQSKEKYLTQSYIQEVKEDVEKSSIVGLKDKILSIFGRGQAQIDKDLDKILEEITKLHNERLELEAKKNHKSDFAPEVPELTRDYKILDWHKKFSIEQKLGNYEESLYAISKKDLDGIYQHVSAHGVVVTQKRKDSTLRTANTSNEGEQNTQQVANQGLTTSATLEEPTLAVKEPTTTINEPQITIHPNYSYLENVLSINPQDNTGMAQTLQANNRPAKQTQNEPEQNEPIQNESKQNDSLYANAKKLESNITLDYDKESNTLTVSSTKKSSHSKLSDENLKEMLEEYPNLDSMNITFKNFRFTENLTLKAKELSFENCVLESSQTIVCDNLNLKNCQVATDGVCINLKNEVNNTTRNILINGLIALPNKDLETPNFYINGVANRADIKNITNVTLHTDGLKNKQGATPYGLREMDEYDE